MIVIDGGKGQLSAGLRALGGLPPPGVAVVSLAKRLEEVFVPGRPAPIVLPHDSPALQLLQRIRDEAHRFAIEHHRIRRDRAMTGSILDELPGIGPARKRALLRHFGSPEAFLAATREELEAVPGLPGKVARDLYAQLNKTGHEHASVHTPRPPGRHNDHMSVSRPTRLGDRLRPAGRALEPRRRRRTSAAPR